MLSRLINSRIPSAANRLRGKVNKQRGDDTEALVKNYLKSLGFGMVEKINTAFILERTNGRITGARPAEQVSGDFSALAAGGISVRVEVKRRQNDKLSLSDFKAHQLPALSNHNALGGISLVTWVTPSLTVYLMRWPFPDSLMRKFHPLTQGAAIVLTEHTLATLRDANGTPWQSGLYDLSGTL